MRKKISVTSNRIKNGEQRMGASCPIALALRGHLNNNIEVTVGRRVILFDKPGTPLITVPLPEKAKQFISAFDEDSDGVEPMSFYLDIPEGCFKIATKKAK